MMDYEFQRTKSDSFSTVSPDQRHISSLSNSTSVMRCLFSDDLRTFAVARYKMNFVVVVSVATFRVNE